ncbi:MAG: type III pantothenate kinase [Chitinophagaceae bacterium]|nr:type III pantothenate kinase [Chitinophagaceae bacterium]
MSVTLCFDFGNTRRKMAVFNDGELDRVEVVADDSDSIRSILDKYKPRKSILSSVVDHNPELESLLEDNTRFHKLNHETKLSFSTPVGKPETIGADRLALISGAVHQFPKQHNLVIALGSAVTYNFCNKFHEFLGGGISPGLEMRLKSLNYYTAKLPLVKASSNAPLIGYDTATNILSGVVLGMAYEIDGFIDEYARKFDNFNVLLTGGDIVFLASHLKNRIFADPDLIFKGLYAISEVNNP